MVFQDLERLWERAWPKASAQVCLPDWWLRAMCGAVEESLWQNPFQLSDSQALFWQAGEVEKKTGGFEKDLKKE